MLKQIPGKKKEVNDALTRTDHNLENVNDAKRKPIFGC